MNQRETYLLQILEKIGAPLMAAITEAGPVDGEPQQAAQHMAAMLGKTVQASIDLGHVMDINPAEAQDDSLRVGLAGLASPLVAGQYRRRGNLPPDPDLKRITGALQAVLTFADNFTPGEDNIQRLQNLEASGQAVSTHQTQIQYMHAFIPVVEAIAAFPFGQPEQKLIMEVSEKLVQKAAELRESLLPNVTDETVEKLVELSLLRALAGLYSACHNAETQKAAKADEARENAGLSMEPVWKEFEIRAAMLEALAKNLAPAGATATGSGPKAPAAPTAPAPAQTPPSSAPPPIAAPPQTGGNPMAGFAKPQTETPPPATPPEPPPVAPPATPPPAQPPEDGGKNPMAFFKKNE